MIRKTDFPWHEVGYVTPHFSDFVIYQLHARKTNLITAEPAVTGASKTELCSITLVTEECAKGTRLNL